MRKKPIEILLGLFAAICLAACGDESSRPDVAISALENIEFEDVKSELDSAEKTVRILSNGKVPDSLVVKSVEAAPWARLFLALDLDPISPEIGEELLPQTVVSLQGTSSFSFVVLDSSARIVSVWTVSIEILAPSSEREKISSSSKEVSSSSGKESSSSSGKPSSSATESSSSFGISGISVLDLSADSGTVTVSSEKVYVELPYGSDLSRVRLSPIDSALDLRRTVQMEFLDSTGTLAVYRVVAGVQLPGSDFDTRNDFWATTSDAMAAEGSATVLGTPYRFTASENLTSDGSSVSISTAKVTCAWTLISGGWKMASGFYFLGSYSGNDARDIYDRAYKSGTPSTGFSDISLDMTFGKPFLGRPEAFVLEYAYTHVANENSDYPQRSLAYVLLLSADGKVVATGTLSDSATVESATRIVRLSYGADPDGLLTGGYAGASGLSLGTGDEDVAEIRVLFASSAYAHVVAGGTAAEASGNYRGGEKATLALQNFRLIY